MALEMVPLNPRVLEVDLLCYRYTIIFPGLNFFFYGVAFFSSSMVSI